MAALLNRARMTTATTGTGTVTLGSASSGYATFAEAGAVNATVYSYCIEDGADFEIGIGTYTSSGTTFSRDTVTVSKISGTAGTSKLNLSGSATIFVTGRAQDLLITDNIGVSVTVSHAGTPLTLTNTTDTAFNTALTIDSDRATPTNGDRVSMFMRASNGSGTQTTYVELAAQVDDITAASEDGTFVVRTVAAGTLAARYTLSATSIAPASNDGAALGISGVAFADLFLASGGVINWNSGNYTITHTAGLLTANGALSLGTSNAFTCGTIELGAASDTTLARSAAGRLSVEGKNALLLGQTDVLTSGYAATPYSAGTKSTGTFTPDEANGNFQYATSGGAHTLAPPTNSCTLVILYANNASAGTVTTSGFTKVTGDSFTTTNGHEFMLYITKHNNGVGFSHLHVTALQ